MPPVSINVPIEMPTIERLEELYREAVAAQIARRDVWLDMDGAAAYLGGMARRTFDRKRKTWGLPVSDLDGTLVVMRADLDAIAKAHLAISGGGTPVIKFPSQAPTPPTPLQSVA